MKRKVLIVAILILSLAAMAAADTGKDTEKEDDRLMAASTFAGLELRNVGPTINSGRITDFAVDPERRHHFFVAVASGGVWKTTNAGTTWTPVFDDEGAYSIGCVELDPTNSDVVWVGTGENNSQRSVSFGDGIYKSIDGGANWKRMGLEDSEHIGMIAIHPEDGNVVYVAAQGPLWKSGGDRGLYKTTDGGEKWERILHISDDTGINEVFLDPSDPETIYASAYQRRRRVWTLINGGPESGIHKSTDGGATWREINEGLPEVDKGKIGMCIAPGAPNTLYAIVEAALDKSGIFRSVDRGETWERRSDYRSVSPQYYNELICDPVDSQRFYSMDTWMHVSTDGGETMVKAGSEFKHVDDHALWIDPEDPEYLLAGCDGGVYESFDRAATWLFKENLPVTQFYRVSVDNSKPFYYIYGGTQDNASIGGPTRTLAKSGIATEDWFITVGGDGYETAVDPLDPNTVYSEWQYGGLVRHDRKSGETVDIQPQEAPGEDAHRWNWDSPLFISPHSHTRLYFACQRVFRSDDRGNSWRAVSPDLSRGLDRDQIEVMGALWSMDAVSKNKSTSDFGNIVSLTESPLVEGLFYAGTDDGLIQISEDGGTVWQRLEHFPGVPDMSYVSRLEASLHDEDTVYAAFSNHKNGDFKPYALVSRDRGRSWSSIAGDLPEKEIVWALMQDHVKPELLFAGTEFGVYFTVDEGKQWVRLKGGMPTIAARDIDIQRRENDLAVGSFGRGFFVLDDYTALRQVSEDALAAEALLFPVKDAPLFIEKRSRHGVRGHGFFTAPNPEFGATFTYYLKDGLKTREELRHKAEKKARENENNPAIPSFDELRLEEREAEPEIMFTVRDAAGEVIRRISGPREEGIHRVSWDLRSPSASPTKLEEKKTGRYDSPDVGPLVVPGTYSVTMTKKENGVLTELAGPEEFQVVPLDLATFTASDREAVRVFQDKVRRLYRAVRAALEVAERMEERLALVHKTVIDTPHADPALLLEVERLRIAHADLMLSLNADPTLAKRNKFQPPSISDRVNRIRQDQWFTTQAPTGTHEQNYRWAADTFGSVLAELKLIDSDLSVLEKQLEELGAPWTPGRFPEWSE